MEEGTASSRSMRGYGPILGAASSGVEKRNKNIRYAS